MPPFPATPGPAVTLVRGAAAKKRLTSDAAGSAAAQTVTLRNRVLSVDEQQPPPDLLAIPNGAHRVEPRVVATKKAAEDATALVPSRGRQ